MAIGAQNAFVLSQSLRREHHIAVALLCIVCDSLLITAGVFGLASWLAQNPLLLAITRWGGIAPWLSRPVIWRLIDMGVAIMMFAVRHGMRSTLYKGLLHSQPPALQHANHFRNG